MNYKDVTINPAEDHMEKYNIEKTELEKANAKMLEISKLQAEQRKEENDNVNKAVKDSLEIVEKNYAGEKIKITKKTAQEYNDIWKAFLEIEPSFKEFMGYGKKTIRKLGYRNFIDFMGWNNVLDVTKWRTNILHVVPCIHCKSHFTTVEQDYGLCPKCKQEYDMPRFIQMVEANEQAEPGSAQAIRIMFMYDATFRDKYKNKTIEQLIQGCIAENFEGFDTYRVIKDMLLKSDGDVSKAQDELYGLICGYKDYELFADKLDYVFSELSEQETLEDKVKVLQEIYLKEAEK